MQIVATGFSGETIEPSLIGSEEQDYTDWLEVQPATRAEGKSVALFRGFKHLEVIPTIDEAVTVLLHHEVWELSLMTKVYAGAIFVLIAY